MKSKKIAIVLLSFYALGHYLTNYQFAETVPYFSYFFDISFFLISTYFYGNHFKFWDLRFDKKFYLSFLFGGILTSILASSLKINIYFDLQSYEILLFLLFIAPVIEELIFRFSLWEPIRELTPNRSWAVIVSSLVFSLSHFFAYFVIVEAFRAFVLYQSFYTFILGIGLGMARKKAGMINPIIYHFLFNAGFAIGLYAIR